MYVLNACKPQLLSTFHKENLLIFHHVKFDGCFIENCIFKS
jgi:hypothetical protein